MAAGEVEADVGGPCAHASTDLEQAHAERVKLQVWLAADDKPAAQRSAEPVDGRVQEQAELIGPEAVVAQALGAAGPLHILAPEFRGAAREGEGVEGCGLIRTGGHDEAGVGAFGQRFGFVDDPTEVRPPLRLIRGVGNQAHFLAGLGVLRGPPP